MSHQERNLYWQYQLEDWRCSGLSGTAFCKQHTLSYHRFMYWRRKLADSASGPETDLFSPIG